jgi:hypothetical protein
MTGSVRRGITVAIAAILVTGCGGAAQRATPLPKLRLTAAHPIEPLNQIVATADAAALLARLALPADATRSNGEPPGDAGTLAHAFSGPPATPNAVDDHAWWVLPERADAVIRYIAAHTPAGGRADMRGASSGSNKPTVNAIGFTWPPIPGKLSTRSLIVEVVRLAGGSTGLRADSQVVSITRRPASERIPSGSTRLVLTTTRFGKVVQGPLTITSPRALHKVVALLNTLPAWQPGVRSCPADSGTRIRLVLYRRARAHPLATVIIDPTGCGEVRLTVGGRPQHPLAGGLTLARRLSRAVGVRLDTGVPAPARR